MKLQQLLSWETNLRRRERANCEKSGFAKSELGYSYPYPCHKKFSEFPTVPISSAEIFTNLLGYGHGYECHSPKSGRLWRRRVGSAICLRAASNDVIGYVYLRPSS